eukprot:g30643.t1
MLNARKIKHLGRVVSNHIVELNKRMRKYEKMLLTGVSPQNGQAMAAGYAAVPSKEPARFANGTAAYSAQEPARLANGTAAYSAQVSATPPALSPQEMCGRKSTLSYGSQKGTQQPLMSLSPPVAYNGYSLPRRVSAEIEKLQQQQIQHENTSKALSGVNGSIPKSEHSANLKCLHLKANYMQSIAQTETVQSSNSFKFDKESGFYKDAKARLYYDPNTTYFFTLDYKKYFMYDSELQLLCLVDSQGKKVPGGQTRPLPSQVAKAGAGIVSGSGRPERTERAERPRRALAVHVVSVFCLRAL